MTGPRDRQVISTRSRLLDCRGLCSLDTSTSRAMTLPSSRVSLLSFWTTCALNRSVTSVCRLLTTMSTRDLPARPSSRSWVTPARPTWSSTPHSPAEGLAALCHYPLLSIRKTSGLPARQDLLLSRTVIGRRRVALRGPLRSEEH